jgi:hypothetical protein
LITVTDGDARTMLKKYSTSAYFTEGGIALARHVPPPTPAELVAGMVTNVDAAKRMRDRVRDRFEAAEADGLFDTDALDSVSDRVKNVWISTIDNMHGDKVRCLGELRHWREYYTWAVRITKDKIESREPGSDDE